MAASEVSRIVDAIPSLAWSCAPNGDLDYINEPWPDYSAMSLAEACAGRWRDAIHPVVVDARGHVSHQGGR